VNDPIHPPAVGRSALSAGIAQVIGRISGLLRDVVFAGFFGAGGTADAFFVAFRVPNMFRELLAEGTLSNVFVPLFAETTEQEGIERAWALANALIGVLLVVLGVLTLGIYAFSEPLVLLVASGFDDTPGKVELAAWLTRLLAPFLAGISIAALFGGMLNVRGKFFLPALAPALLNVAIIAACIWADTWTEVTSTPAIGAVAVAATISGILTAAIQLPALRQLGFRFRPTLRRHPAMGRVLRYVGAALVGVIVVQFNLIVETQLASREGDGAVSWLMLGFRLVQIPMSVIAGSVAVAALARFSLDRAREDHDGSRETLTQAMEGMFLLVIPAAVGLYLLADPLVALCFERGAFTASDTEATATILRGYAFAVVGICAYRVLLPIFFALGDPYLPMKLSLVVMVIKIPVALALLNAWGLIGLPLSHAVTVSVEVAIMMSVLHRRLGGWTSGFFNEFIRILVASLLMGAVVFGFDGLIPQMGALRVILLCGLGAGAFGVFAAVLQIRSLAPLWARIQRRMAASPPRNHK
jgi:putative peptidoglycan lipid II flippase